MIEIIGAEGSEEYNVAVALRDGFAKLWPGIEKSPSEVEHVRIAANTKLAGYKVSDIDVVIAAAFGRQRFFVPRKMLRDQDGKKVVGARVRVLNFVAAVEVKGHSSDGVRIAGDEVEVRYKSGWKSATGQNVDQVHALAGYLSDQWAKMYVFRCLAMQGLPQLLRVNGMECPAAGAVPLGFDATAFLTAIAGVSHVFQRGGEYVLSSGNAEAARKTLDASIFRSVVPSRLDRQRMDRIAAQKPEATRLAALLGRERVHIRGHGGAGKTVLVLQAAHQAFDLHGKRCLVLTYNLALAADIQRLLALLGVPSGIEGGGVEVRTAMSFMFRWLRFLGVVSDETQSSYDDYPALCSEALALFDGGALADEDILRIIRTSPEELEFDAVIVDEAQDWPQPEADLLARIYGASKIALADGRDQLVRGRATNWKRTLEPSQPAEELALSRCLRMKRNLGVFANAVAREAGLNWEIEPSDEAAGGKVILVSGSYADHPELRAELLASAISAGNDKIDFLHCVPPAAVRSHDGKSHSLLGAALVAEGHDAWDAVDRVARHDFPRSVDTFRVLQYDSSRGLEGWTTVLDDFDSFWIYKYQQALASLDGASIGAGRSPERIASDQAWRWAMIALTRPIDTLVISYSDQGSMVGKLLSRLAAEFPDFVETR